MFGEGVISTRPLALLDLVLGAREDHGTAATAREPVGVPWASPCCGLLGDVTERTSQLVRSSYMILFATQNRREAGNCPADRIWAKCCGKMHLSCTQCCTKTRFPDSERVQKFFTIYIPLLLKWLFIKPFVTWSFYLNTERTLLFQYHAPFPSAEHQAGQEAQNLAGMKRILYE